jgi:serine/threonine-protein kinase
LARVGTVLEGKYEILKQIGKGGMSKVYLAMDKRLNKQWAVKEIQRRGRDEERNEVVVNSAMVEANMIKSLDHYHIPHINDILEYEDYIYVVMDYIEGESLMKIIQVEGPQSQAQVIKWGKQLCDALNYLHTRKPAIIYRDMKPSNVMIKPDGDVKLVDFGIAREYKERNIADTTVLGTVGYAPPEQFGGGQTDARADIYALGTTLYHAVTGHGPTKGEAYIIEPIRNWNANLSGGLEKIIMKCTKQNPAERYQNCTELMYDLEHYREVDDAFLSVQRSKLKTFGVVLGLAVVFLLVGIFGQVMRVYDINQDYTVAINEAKTENVDYAKKAQSYLRALELKPTSEEAYTGLIDTYSASTFGTDESHDLLGMVKPNLETLKTEPFFPKLVFDIGTLYWYSYSYGQNGDDGTSGKNTKMTSAIPWFEYLINYADTDAQNEYYLANKDIANVYYNIGKFHEDISIKQRKLIDDGEYIKYWENIEELQQLLREDIEQKDDVKFAVDELVMDAIIAYAIDIKSDGTGVTQTRMQEAFDEAYASAETITYTNRRQIIEEKSEYAKAAIETAYRVRGE